MCGESSALQAVVRSARLVAATDATTLILGKSGTGKEQLARLVHAGSESWQLPSDGICLDALERQLIHQALDHSAGNRSQAARLLGLTRDTLLYRMKKHAIT